MLPGPRTFAVNPASCKARKTFRTNNHAGVAETPALRVCACLLALHGSPGAFRANGPARGGPKQKEVIIMTFGEKLKEVSIGATALLGGLGGAALGTAGGFAAAGATTAAVAALGTASTGAAISGLTGVAATSATLAVLGGGTLAAGGGGVALGTVLLGAATLGVGLMVGGILFNFVGGSISDKADEAWNQMLEAEEKINKACSYMDELYDAARDYLKLLEDIKSGYDASFREFRRLVDEKMMLMIGRKMKCSWRKIACYSSDCSIRCAKCNSLSKVIIKKNSIASTTRQ